MSDLWRFPLAITVGLEMLTLFPSNLGSSKLLRHNMCPWEVHHSPSGRLLLYHEAAVRLPGPYPSETFWMHLTGGKGPSPNIDDSNVFFQEKPLALFHFFLITILSILAQLLVNSSKYFLTQENKQKENM